MRFSQSFGNMPYGYDHKYIYSHLGYNLKVSDWQAAIGVAQMEKLPAFIEARRANFKYLYENLKRFEDIIILPKKVEASNPSWFGFLISLKENSGLNKMDFIRYLDKNKVGTRQLFAGNILRQPAFLDGNYNIRIRNSELLKSNELTESHYSMLPTADYIMNNTFWIGVWPGINEQRLEYMVKTISNYFDKENK